MKKYYPSIIKIILFLIVVLLSLIGLRSFHQKDSYAQAQCSTMPRWQDKLEVLDTTYYTDSCAHTSSGSNHPINNTTIPGLKYNWQSVCWISRLYLKNIGDGDWGWCNVSKSGSYWNLNCGDLDGGTAACRVTCMNFR